MARKNKRITESGLTMPHGMHKIESDIILQMPELFFFDMNSYISSLNAAKSIDFYSRVQLYDMYESSHLDLHLWGLIDKRRIGVSRIPIEFRRDGKPDDKINEEIRSPWFRKFVKDVLMSKFYGFFLAQFYRDEHGWINYYKVPIKHYDPVKREIMRYQTDTTGQPLQSFPNMLLVCDDPRDLGMLADLMPMVLYKRGNMADWAQFCEIFGMPIREYTYDAGDEEARKRLIQDARSQGANAVYIHPKESALNLIESANKSGTIDLYERLKDACNTEMSVRVLGNTLTTDAKSTGTQALGTVHKEEEDELKADDRDFVLDVLNYEMTDIFNALGVDTAGGEFVYVQTKSLNPNQQVDVISKAKAMGLPISDDYIYETLLIEKPDNYDEMKAEIKAKEEADRRLKENMANSMNDIEEASGKAEKAEQKATLKNRLKGFFSHAPKDGALEF